MVLTNPRTLMEIFLITPSNYGVNIIMLYGCSKMMLHGTDVYEMLLLNVNINKK